MTGRPAPPQSRPERLRRSPGVRHEGTQHHRPLGSCRHGPALADGARHQLVPALHWLTAALILTMVVLGLIMTDLPLGERKFALYQLHKSIGLTILGLGAARLAWRLTNPVPRLPATLRPWERGLAHTTHIAMYGLILALPLSGWIMSSAKGFPVSVFGWFTLPDLVSENEVLAARATIFHEIAVYLLIFFLLLHISGALKHHFIDRDETLKRMAPVLKMSARRAAMTATPWRSASASDSSDASGRA